MPVNLLKPFMFKRIDVYFNGVHPFPEKWPPSQGSPSGTVPSASLWEAPARGPRDPAREKLGSGSGASGARKPKLASARPSGLERPGGVV